MSNKFIVFCYHRDLISAITEVLAKRDTGYIRIAGDVPPEVRAVGVMNFPFYCRFLSSSNNFFFFKLEFRSHI